MCVITYGAISHICYNKENVKNMGKLKVSGYMIKVEYDGKDEGRVEEWKLCLRDNNHSGKYS